MIENKIQTVASVKLRESIVELSKEISSMKKISRGIANTNLATSFMKHVGLYFFEISHYLDEQFFIQMDAFEDRINTIKYFLEIIYANMLENMLRSVFEDDEWITVCKMRSNIKAFNMLFFKFSCDGIDTEDIDYLIKQKNLWSIDIKCDTGYPLSQKKIDQEIALSNAITRAYENKNNYGEIILLMDLIGEFYLEHYQYHLQDSIAVCIRQKEQIQALAKRFFEYTQHLKTMLTWSFEYNEWTLCCHRRSNIEACIILFADTLEHFSFYLDPECLDELMKSKGEVEGGCFLDNEIPHHIPKTHWWWFL